MSAAAVRNPDDSDAQLARGESEGTDNLTLTSSTPKPPPFEATGDFNSDLAFENRYAYGGNYDGVQIWDVRDNETPRLASSIHCPGSQNDVTVNDGILVTSTDSVRNKAECEGNVSVPTTSPEYGQPSNWEGLRVFDVFEISHKRINGAKKFNCDTLNAQTQEQFSRRSRARRFDAGPQRVPTQNQGVVVRFRPAQIDNVVMRRRQRE
jgi:hypothetical protein